MYPSPRVKIVKELCSQVRKVVVCTADVIQVREAPLASSSTVVLLVPPRIVQQMIMCHLQIFNIAVDREYRYTAVPSSHVPLLDIYWAMFFRPLTLLLHKIFLPVLLRILYRKPCLRF